MGQVSFLLSFCALTSVACRVGFERKQEAAPAADIDASAEDVDANAADGCEVDELPDPEQLVLHFTFDEDRVIGVPDASGNELDGVCLNLSGCPVLGDGKLSSGYVFDGERRDRLTVSCLIRVDLELRGGFTVATWVNADRSNGLILAKTLPTAHVGAGAASLALRLDEQAHVSFETEDGVGARHKLASPTPLTHGWHHVAAVFDGDRKQLFIDGQSVGESEGAYIDFDRGNFVVGASDNNPAFDGSLDDLRIYDRSHSGEAIAALASCGADN